MKWLIDYHGIQKNVIRSMYKVHQAFLPEGFRGADNENLYHQDVAKAKALLAKAGLANGFTVKMDVRNDYPPVQRDRAGGAGQSRARQHQGATRPER